MKNYKDSDYALNKFSTGIVYRFADGIVEITLSDYLAENPHKTEQDFLMIKEISDEIYLKQVRHTNKTTKKDISIHNVDNYIDDSCLLPDEQCIEKQEKILATNAIHKLLSSNILTEIQKRRFSLYIIEGLPIRKIAEIEHVHFTSVAESIESVMEKVKKLLQIF